MSGKFYKIFHFFENEKKHGLKDPVQNDIRHFTFQIQYKKF